MSNIFVDSTIKQDFVRFYLLMQFHRNGICHRFGDVLKRKVRNVFTRVRKGSNMRYAFFNLLFWLLLLILPKSEKRVRQWNNHVKINKINDCVRPFAKRERVILYWIRFYWEGKWIKWNNGINTFSSSRFLYTSPFLHTHAAHNHTNQYNNKGVFVLMYQKCYTQLVSFNVM